MFDFSSSLAFGFKGDIFIAESGALPPGTGATDLAGYKVARIDRNSGQVSDFIAHPDNSPATIFANPGFNKPIDVHFRGPEMFIVDMGVSAGASPQIPNTGKVWKVAPSCGPIVAIIGMDDNGKPIFADAPCD
jgi:hypothetical protein